MNSTRGMSFLGVEWFTIFKIPIQSSWGSHGCKIGVSKKSHQGLMLVRYQVQYSKGKTKPDLYNRLVNVFGAWKTSFTVSRKIKIPHFRNSICCFPKIFNVMPICFHVSIALTMSSIPGVAFQTKDA